MLKFGLLGAIIGLLLTFAAPAAAKIVISKVRIGSTTATDEYVELYNSGSTTTLLGWGLKKQTAGGTISNLLTSFPTIDLGQQGFLLIGHPNAVTLERPADLTYSTSASLAANNSVLLHNQAGELIDQASWGASGTMFTFPLPEPEIEAATTSSPTLSPKPPDWSKLVINEFMPHPTAGEEWIEFYNQSSSSINLDDLILCDGRETGCTIATPTGTIGGNDWHTIFLNNSFLNNAGDTISLKNPAGTIIDSVAYGTATLPAPEIGQSLARQTNSNDWSRTLTPTPGAANVITLPSPPAPTLPPSRMTGETTETKITPTKKSQLPAPPAPITLIWKITAPTYALLNEPVQLDASQSADPRGGALFYTWNFGDGAIVEGGKVEHRFTTTGTIKISVAATSTQSTAGQQTVDITVFERPTSDSIRLSEVLPNPSGEDTSEFVELFNPTTSSLEISGWKLVLPTGKSYLLPASTTLASHSYLILQRAATGLELPNTTTLLSLFNASGGIVDMISFGPDRSGQSYARTIFGWQWSEPTPGYATEGTVLAEKIVTTTPQKPTKKKAGVQTTAPGSLREAREATKGARFTVHGTVTALPGTFGVQFFYIEDQTAGLQIYSPKKQFPPLALGDLVAVEGAMTTLKGTPRLKSDMIRVIGRGSFTTATSTIVELDENQLGKLVTLHGTITQIKNNWLYLDDGADEIVVYFKPGSNIEKKVFRAGDNLAATGVLEQTTRGFEIWPRNENDLTITEQLTPAIPTSNTRRPIFWIAGLTGAMVLGIKKYRQRV